MFRETHDSIEVLAVRTAKAPAFLAVTHERLNGTRPRCVALLPPAPRAKPVAEFDLKTKVYIVALALALKVRQGVSKCRNFVRYASNNMLF